MSKRDDFKESTKRIMAERVAWRCSFPDCGKITIGPRMGQDEGSKSLNLGEAAHIVAAAEDGPRFDKKTSPDYRCSIENGIWMCRAHARFIDTDHKEYSIETLKLWKVQAEEQAYRNLKLQDNYKFEDRSTLITIGFDVLLYGTWMSVKSNEWEFLIGSYLKGSSNNLKNYSDNFDSIELNQRFISVESQGDARIITSPIAVDYSSDGSELFRVKIEDKVIAKKPSSVGSTIKLDDNGDLDLSGGGLKRISGIDAAIQSVPTSAGTLYGELFTDRTVGSFITNLFNEYKENIPLLEMVIKLELIRLSLVPRMSSDKRHIDPPLNFIKEIVSIRIPSVALDESRLSMELTLILGDETEWKGNVKVFILQT
jgi:hypothetical protein